MTDPQPDRRGGALCLLLTSVGWGLNWPVMKGLIRELPPLFARGTAGLAAAIGFALVAIALGQRLRVEPRRLPRLAWAAFLNVFAWMGLSTLALRWLTVGQSVLLVYTMPVWAMLFAWPVSGQRPDGRAIAGLALSMLGLWVMFGGGGLVLDADRLLGGALALAAAALFAWGTVTLEPVDGLQPFALLAWQVGLGCAPMVVLGLLFEPLALGGVSTHGWLSMLYVSVVPMGLCYLTWFAALRRLPATIASIGMLLTPMVGVVSAALMLGEPFGLREVLSLALTLGGVAFVIGPRAGRRAPQADA
ncbi:MAG: DMT family transporter [Burkholderiaceae bacterium]